MKEPSRFKVKYSPQILTAHHLTDPAQGSMSDTCRESRVVELEIEKTPIIQFIPSQYRTVHFLVLIQNDSKSNSLQLTI